MDFRVHAHNNIQRAGFQASRLHYRLHSAVRLPILLPQKGIVSLPP